MADETYILSDKNLLNTISEDEVKELAQLFSYGKFDSICNKINIDYIKKFSNDIYSQQIILTLYIYSLLKQTNYNEAKQVYNSFDFQDKTIFPLQLLKAKLHQAQKEINIAIQKYREIITKYESYLSNVDTLSQDTSNIITIETFKSQFTTFQNVFIYLFAINNNDSKLKKAYFDLKNCLSSMNFTVESYNIIQQLYQRYPKDLVIIFEYAKDSIMLSYVDKYKELLEEMIKQRDELGDDKAQVKQTYDNYIAYTKSLMELAKCNYDETKKYYEAMLEKDKDNVVLLNNLAVLEIYGNNPSESYKKLNYIADSKKLDCNNDVVKHNLTVVSDTFHKK